MPALAVAAVATVASSAISANSANRAAKAQKRAAGEAMEVANDIAQEDLGTQKELESLMQGRLNEARSSTQSAVRGAADSYNAKADEALGAINDGYGRAADDVRDGYGSAIDATKAGYGQARADLQPYSDTGASALDRLYKTFITGENSYQATDPGYAFRLAEGTKALERSAAARGGLYSGATGKALTNYAQGAASQEFQNSYGRLLPLANMGLQTAGQLSNLAVGQGRDLAALSAGQGRDIANLTTGQADRVSAIRQGQGSYLGNLAMQDGLLDLNINNGRNEITNAYGARTSSILQNLSRAMQSGQQAYGDASAAGTLGVGGAIGSGISTLGNLALLGGSNLFGSSSNLGRVGYSSGVVNSQTGRMIGGV